MPFVRIGAHGTATGRLDALGRAVRDAAADTLRYDGHPGVRRDETIVFVAMGTEPRNVFVTLAGNTSADRSSGHGIVQYVGSGAC